MLTHTNAGSFSMSCHNRTGAATVGPSPSTSTSPPPFSPVNREGYTSTPDMLQFVAAEVKAFLEEANMTEALQLLLQQLVLP